MLIAKTNIKHSNESPVHLILLKKKHRTYPPSSKTQTSFSLFLFRQYILCTWLLGIIGGILIYKKLVNMGEATIKTY